MYALGGKSKHLLQLVAPEPLRHFDSLLNQVFEHLQLHERSDQVLLNLVEYHILPIPLDSFFLQRIKRRKTTYWLRLLLNVLHELINPLSVTHRFMNQHVPEEISVCDVELQRKIYSLCKILAVIDQDLDGLLFFPYLCEKVCLLLESSILMTDLHSFKNVDVLSLKQKPEQLIWVILAVQLNLLLVIFLADL